MPSAVSGVDGDPRGRGREGWGGEDDGRAEPRRRTRCRPRGRGPGDGRRAGGPGTRPARCPRRTGGAGRGSARVRAGRRTPLWAVAVRCPYRGDDGVVGGDRAGRSRLRRLRGGLPGWDGRRRRAPPAHRRGVCARHDAGPGGVAGRHPHLGAGDRTRRWRRPCRAEPRRRRSPDRPG